MQKTALICGSYAFDSIMLFKDKFKNHILPDKVHILNVSFHVPEMRKEFGGCAGNIAYNLNLLGDCALPMATVGVDFSPYQKNLDQLGINSKYITTIAKTYTAQAFITTDQDDNQITAFHPGAMDYSQQNDITKLKPEADIAIISPDGKQGMINHAGQLAQLGMPFIFDPGQGLPMFNQYELLEFINQASWITLNDYEAQLLMDKTKLALPQIARQVKALIITKGVQGASIYHDDTVLEIPALPAQSLDPTGCGDAFRTGLLYGMTRHFDWQTSGQLASLMGAIKVGTRGTQNHQFSLNKLKKDYLKHYKTPLP